MKIFSATGDTLYILECHQYGYERDPNFSYSGAFECRLKSASSSDSYSTLLTDDPHQSRDWESRGRFLVQELVGECARYPEYGLERSFRVRGMLITLRMSDLKWSRESHIANPALDYRTDGASEYLTSFNFEVDVKSDPSATSEIAERVQFQHPPRANPGMTNDLRLDCNRVLKRNLH
jgi:hypothetical protein